MLVWVSYVEARFLARGHRYALEALPDLDVLARQVLFELVHLSSLHHERQMVTASGKGWAEMRIRSGAVLSL